MKATETLAQTDSFFSAAFQTLLSDDGFHPVTGTAYSDDEHIVKTSGSHNCGGRCVIKAHVKNGRILRITTEDDQPDAGAALQLRGCLRCRSYRTRLYDPNRLKYPMKRVGKRGEGRFERISWDEALDTVAAHLKQTREEYGPDAIFMLYATGNAGRTGERPWMSRLLGLDGGYLSYYGSYSTACTEFVTPYLYGTFYTGNSREDWANAKLILLMGFNPAETVHGTNTTYYLKKAREAGARIISIDPLYTSTAVALADQWIPIRPTTDSALLEAMAYVMITENLCDRNFLDTFCQGFDGAHMPEGIPPGNDYSSHILGLGADGTAKTPQWASPITGIPEASIVALAREYATAKPAALIQGFGPQRHAYGEQVVRGGIALAAMTGNVGIPGGWACGTGYPARQRFVASVPVHNPNPARISMYCWPEAVAAGKGMGPDRSVVGAEALTADIKVILNLGGNTLINQHTDCNGTAKLLGDESKVSLIVTAEQFLTPSARFSDILLPADNMMERDDIVKSWGFGDYALYMNKAVETVFECRNGYDWVGDLAERLGHREAFEDGKDLQGWLQWLVEETQSQEPGFPDFETFRRNGVHRWHSDGPDIAFKEQVESRGAVPFNTPSGRIEIFSKPLWDKANPQEISGIPKYVPAWEGPEDPLYETYPLQCIGHHTRRRVHSIFDNSAWMEGIEPHGVWISPGDAAARSIRNGDPVRVFNDRGVATLPAVVTPRIMPGVVSIPQGAWFSPDGSGVDRRGCINTLTRYKPTPLAFGNPSHTALVQIEREARP